MLNMGFALTLSSIFNEYSEEQCRTDTSCLAGAFVSLDHGLLKTAGLLQ